MDQNIGDLLDRHVRAKSMQITIFHVSTLNLCFRELFKKGIIQTPGGVPFHTLSAEDQLKYGYESPEIIADTHNKILKDIESLSFRNSFTGLSWAFATAPTGMEHFIFCNRSDFTLLHVLLNVIKHERGTMQLTDEAVYGNVKTTWFKGAALKFCSFCKSQFLSPTGDARIKGAIHAFSVFRAKLLDEGSNNSKLVSSLAICLKNAWKRWNGTNKNEKEKSNINCADKVEDTTSSKTSRRQRTASVNINASPNANGSTKPAKSANNDRDFMNKRQICKHCTACNYYFVDTAPSCVKCDSDSAHHVAVYTDVSDLHIPSKNAPDCREEQMYRCQSPGCTVIFFAQGIVLDGKIACPCCTGLKVSIEAFVVERMKPAAAPVKVAHQPGFDEFD